MIDKTLLAKADELESEISELELELAQKNKELEAIYNELDSLERNQEIRDYERSRL